MKLTINGITVESENPKDLLNESLVDLLIRMREKAKSIPDTPKVKKVKKTKKDKRTGRSCPRWSQLEMNILRVNINRPIKKLYRMLAKAHTPQSIQTMKYRIRSGKV